MSTPTTIADMHGEEYAAALAALNLSQVSGARFLGVSDRLSRYWIANRAPVRRSSALLLRTMLALALTPERVLELEREVTLRRNRPAR